MMKKTLVFLVLISLFAVFSIFTAACNSDGGNEVDNPESSQVGLDEWKLSDDAVDLNGDRKIDGTDYELFFGYDDWKKLETAEDYNGDRKINFDDYKFYLDMIAWKNSDSGTDLDGDSDIDYDDYSISLSDDLPVYAAWVLSDEVYDYNKDGKFTSEDYALYLERKDLVGKCLIRNFAANQSVYLDDEVFNNVLQDVLAQVIFNVDRDLQITCIYDSSLEQRLGDKATLMKATLDSFSLVRLSDSNLRLDFTVIDGIPYAVSFYFLRINETKWTAMTNVKIDEEYLIISFDLMYIVDAA